MSVFSQIIGAIMFPYTIFNMFILTEGSADSDSKQEVYLFINLVLAGLEVKTVVLVRLVL